VDSKLFDGQYDPITFGVGLLECDIDQVVADRLRWMTSVGTPVRATWFNDSLESMLLRLLPLAYIGTKELWVSTATGGTARFDNCSRGPDNSPPISVLALRLKCRGIDVTSVPDIPKVPATGERGTWGVESLTVYAPHNTTFLNIERLIQLSRDDAGGWTFENDGEQYPFEDAVKYMAKRKRERFTREMLLQYAIELGHRPFDEDFYQPRGALVLFWNGALFGGNEHVSLPETRSAMGL
jgi:hypothetical protein